MEIQIILITTIVLAVGIAVGLILASVFELDSYDRHRRNLRAKRKARRQKNRKNGNITVDFF